VVEVLLASVWDELYKVGRSKRNDGTQKLVVIWNSRLRMCPCGHAPIMDISRIVRISGERAVNELSTELFVHIVSGFK